MNPASKSEDLQRSFRDFNSAAERIQSAFSSLEHKFAKINRELEEKNRELKKTVSEKEEVQSYLQNIIESLSTGVIVTDLEGRITILNGCAEAFCGVPHASAAGRPVEELFRGMRAKSPKGVLDVRLLTGEAPRRIRLGERIVELFGSLVRDNGGEVIGRIYILRDVTRMEKLEEMAKRTEKLAAMGEMAANIAHEIRNPLGSIELFASLVRKDIKDKKNQDRLMQVIASVKNVDNRISNLLLFARRRNPVMRSMRLHKILDDVLHFTRQITERDGITLRENFSPCDPLVRGDAEMLKQVFLNIILNALQSMPEGGRLTISTVQREAGTVEISFGDTGAGIPEENLGKIFDPLFSTRERGAGLGLAIVHNLVDLHGGAIEVESGPEGTVFTVSLPAIRRQRGK